MEITKTVYTVSDRGELLDHRAVAQLADGVVRCVSTTGNSYTLQHPQDTPRAAYAAQRDNQKKLEDHHSELARKAFELRASIAAQMQSLA